MFDYKKINRKSIFKSTEQHVHIVGQVVIPTFQAVHDRSQEACAVCGKLAFEKNLFDIGWPCST